MEFPNIAAERAKRKMSVRQLAQNLGVCHKTVYNWKSSGRIPQKYVEKMCQMFNCSADYLLSHDFDS